MARSIFGVGEDESIPALPIPSDDGSAASDPSVHAQSIQDILSEEPHGTRFQRQSSADGSAAESELEDNWEDAQEDDWLNDRPNQFEGPPRTWQHYIAKERRVASSIEQVRASDISAHLYNVFALKRRLRPVDPTRDVANWKSKHRWAQDDNKSNWIPPPAWSAWPLEPGHVPGLDEEFCRREVDGLDSSTITTQKAGMPRSEVEELLLASILRQAKDRFRARFPPLPPPPKQKKAGAKKVRVNEKNKKTEKEPVTLSHDGRSLSSDYETASEGEDAQTALDGSEQQLDTSMRDEDSDHRAQQLPAHGEKGYQSATSFASDSSLSDANDPSPQVEEKDGVQEYDALEANVLADDEKARRILQPSINSIISRLESLLVTLHQSRYDHHNGSNSERDAVTLPPQNIVGSNGYPVPDPKEIPKEEIRVEEQTANTTSDTKIRPGKKGRPNIYGQPLPGETYHGMRKRLDSSYRSLKTSTSKHTSFEKQHLPSTADINRNENPAPVLNHQSIGATASRRLLQHHATPTGNAGMGADATAPERTGLRDWSEVIGLASMTGWDERIISRAAQRCSTLFGEKMMFRTLDETRALAPPSAPFDYLPQAIPASIVVDSSRPRAARNPRPHWDRQTLRCPHLGCWGHHKEFKIAYRVVEHIKRVHGYDPRTTEAVDGGSEMEGGVHVDGFLRPIYPKQGWRGVDVGKSEKRIQSMERRKAKKRRRSGSVSNVNVNVNVV